MREDSRASWIVAQIRQTSDVEIPASTPRAFTSSSTSREDPVDIVLHYHRVEGQIEPASTFKLRRKDQPRHSSVGILRSRSPVLVKSPCGRDRSASSFG